MRHGELTNAVPDRFKTGKRRQSLPCSPFTFSHFQSAKHSLGSFAAVVCTAGIDHLSPRNTERRGRRFAVVRTTRSANKLTLNVFANAERKCNMSQAAIRHPHHHGDAATMGLFAAILVSVGVVYGDIGTSPLYALEVTMKAFGGSYTTADVYGVVSLISWALVVYIVFKYTRWVMQADNDGQGGILALVNLLQDRKAPLAVGSAVVIGALGTGLLIADGAITPAISNLSALEGLQVIWPEFPRLWIVLGTLAVLALLFAFQYKGTDVIGKCFGPVMVAWFLAIGVIGAYQIYQHPSVLVALSPTYAFGLFVNHFWTATVLMGIIGGVFLAMTGGEALYADMGHIGRRPISIGFTYFVLPMLILNYLGQGALLVENHGIDKPFFEAVPEQFRVPMVVLATLATIIASQALISGVFSLAQQAVQMTLLPRQRIDHTSKHAVNQVYVPTDNYLLMFGSMLLVLAFQTSDNLAAAYGLSVCGTMLATTILRYQVAVKVWQQKVSRALIPAVLFGIGDVIFLGSNSLKIPEGGWLPLAAGLFFTFLFLSQRYGARSVREELKRRSSTESDFFAQYAAMNRTALTGVGVILTKLSENISAVVLHELRNGGSLFEDTVLYSIVIEQIPFVKDEHRLEYSFIKEVAGVRFHRVIAHFGYMERLHVEPVVFAALRHKCAEAKLFHPHLFIPHEKLHRRPRSGEGRLSYWLKTPSWMAFVVMKKLAAEATDFFGIKQLECTKQVHLWLDIDYAYGSKNVAAE
jgi:KUP system potassium uptake protein